MAEKVKSIFESMYSATKESIKLAKKPLVEKRLKRKFQSAYDDAEDRKLNAEVHLERARREFEGYNINSVLQAKETIDKCSKVQEKLRAEYAEYFGTIMRV